MYLFWGSDQQAENDLRDWRWIPRNIAKFLEIHLQWHPQQHIASNVTLVQMLAREQKKEGRKDNYVLASGVLLHHYLKPRGSKKTSWDVKTDTVLSKHENQKHSSQHDNEVHQAKYNVCPNQLLHVSCLCQQVYILPIDTIIKCHKYCASNIRKTQSGGKKQGRRNWKLLTSISNTFSFPLLFVHTHPKYSLWGFWVYHIFSPCIILQTQSK